MPQLKVINLFFFLLFSSIVFGQADTITKKSEKAVLEMTKSPWGAVLRSAILPGWGQLYNESYWKIPVVLGTSGWFVGNAIYNHNKYTEFVNNFNKTGSYTDQKKRDFYRNQRDDFYIYAGLTYFLNLVDAYVDAHLFDFNVIDDTGGTQKIMITYTFRF